MGRFSAEGEEYVKASHQTYTVHSTPVVYITSYPPIPLDHIALCHSMIHMLDRLTQLFGIAPFTSA